MKHMEQVIFCDYMCIMFWHWEIILYEVIKPKFSIIIIIVVACTLLLVDFFTWLILEILFLVLINILFANVLDIIKSCGCLSR